MVTEICRYKRNMNVHQKIKLLGFGDIVMYFGVLFLNFNWFSEVIWVIYPLFWSTPVPSRSISKVGTESRGNLGDFCKIDACHRKWSTQACSNISPEWIRTSELNRIINRFPSRWGFTCNPLELLHLAVVYFVIVMRLIYTTT